MAAPTKERKQIPKLFSERAKQASVQAQVALDLLEAQMKGDFAQKKAKLKAQGNMAGFMGGQLDGAMQARADREAQGEPEPVGPELNVAPLPSASQPSQGLAGATGMDLNSLLTQPGAVQGGAGIQAATGGLGRAQPSEVNPGQLQAQVPQYNVSQTTSEGNQNFDVGGRIVSAPISRTNTTISPNQLTPFQLGRLQQLEQTRRDAGVAKQFEAESHLAENLAGTLYGIGTGHLSPAELKASIAATQETLTSMGYSPERVNAVLARAQTQYGKYATEREQNSSSEFMKTLHTRDQEQIGSDKWKQLDSRLDALTKRDPRSEAERRYLETLQRGPIIEVMEKHTRQNQAIRLLTKIRSITDTNPEAFGASGTLQKGVTALGGAASSLADLVGIEDQQKLVQQATTDLASQLQNSQQPDGTISEEDQKAFNDLRLKLYDPKMRGTVGQLEAALRIIYAGIYFKTLNVRAVETVMKDRINLTGAQSIEEVKAALDTAISEVTNMKADTEKHMGIIGVPIPDYGTGTELGPQGGIGTKQPPLAPPQTMRVVPLDPNVAKGLPVLRPSSPQPPAR